MRCLLKSYRQLVDLGGASGESLMGCGNLKCELPERSSQRSSYILHLHCFFLSGDEVASF